MPEDTITATKVEIDACAKEAKGLLLARAAAGDLDAIQTVLEFSCGAPGAAEALKEAFADDIVELREESAADPKSKFYDSELKAVDDDEGTFTATITTGAVDRDHEIIIAKGVSFENFLKVPVVMFGHDHHGLPIGKALWVKSARGGKIIAKVKVAPTEFAQEVFELIKGGFLSAVSIGFRPIGDKNGPPTEKEIAKNPDMAGARWVYRESDLLEFSVVNVPANPEALITAVGKGAVSLSKQMSDVLDIDMCSPVQTIMRLEQEIERMQLVERVQAVQRMQSVERFLTDEQIIEKVGRELRRRLGRAY